ncbi:MAG: EamA family transporter [Candidatus Nanopelagicales bacterium]
MTDHDGHEGRGRAVLSVLAAATLFGTTGTAQALGPSGTTPLGVGAVRIAVGGAGLVAALPWLGGSRRDALGLWRTRWGLAAGLTTALYQVCFFAGVSRAGVALGTLVTIGSGPVFTGLLSWLLLRERPRLSWVVATAVCVVGLALLVGSGATQSGVDPVGLLLALASGLGYAVYTVAAKRLMTDGHRSDEVMAGAFSLGGLVLVPVLLTQPMAWLATPSGLALALWLGLATTTAAYVLFGRGLRHLPAGPVTTLVLAEPVVATVLGVVVLGEHLAPLGWVGAALVLAGLVLQGVAASRGRG